MGSRKVLKRFTRHSENEPFFLLPYALCHMQSSWTIECWITGACYAVNTVVKKGSQQWVTLWKDGSSVLFADNDFDASSVANITGKIYNKKKKEFKGRRAYAANDAVRCYQCVHNSVDIHNQLAAYGNWGYRTCRKQMRVPICFQIICRL